MTANLLLTTKTPVASTTVTQDLRVLDFHVSSHVSKCLLGNRASIAIFPHTVRGPCPKTALVLFRYTEPRLACLRSNVTRVKINIINKP